MRPNRLVTPLLSIMAFLLFVVLFRVFNIHGADLNQASVAASASAFAVIGSIGTVLKLTLDLD